MKNAQYKLAILVVCCMGIFTAQAWCGEPSYQELLTQAAAEGRTDIVQWLYSKGADSNSRDASGAAANRRMEVLNWLNENSADVNAKNHNSETPGAAAAQNNSQEVLDWLNNGDAGLDRSDNRGSIASQAPVSKSEALDWLNDQSDEVKPPAQPQKQEILDWLNQ